MSMPLVQHVSTQTKPNQATLIVCSTLLHDRGVWLRTATRSWFSLFTLSLSHSFVQTEQLKHSNHRNWQTNNMNVCVRVPIMVVRMNEWMNKCGGDDDDGGSNAHFIYRNLIFVAVLSMCISCVASCHMQSRARASRYYRASKWVCVEYCDIYSWYFVAVFLYLLRIDYVLYSLWRIVCSVLFRYLLHFLPLHVWCGRLASCVRVS